MRGPFLMLAGVAVCVSAAVAVIVGESAGGLALFGGSALLGGLLTAWLIARKASDPLALAGGAILVMVVSLVAFVLMVYVTFAITGAGD